MTFDVDAAWAQVTATWADKKTPRKLHDLEWAEKHFREEVQTAETFAAVWPLYTTKISTARPTPYVLPYLPRVVAAIREAKGDDYGPQRRAREHQEACKRQRAARTAALADLMPVAEELCAFFPRRHGHRHNQLRIAELLKRHVPDSDREALMTAARKYTAWAEKKLVAGELDAGRVYSLERFITTHWQRWRPVERPVEIPAEPGLAPVVSMAAWLAERQGARA